LKFLPRQSQPRVRRIQRNVELERERGDGRLFDVVPDEESALLDRQIFERTQRAPCSMAFSSRTQA
jgi:hypothetical protein